MAPQTEEQKSAEKKKERAEIVYKYGRGREEGAEIDAWEDPRFELYQRTDRFGFIHDARSPLVRQLADDRRIIDKEMERVEKWLKMCRNWDVYYNSDKFRSRIYKGIPDKVRGEVWIKLLGIRKVQAKDPGGTYETMLNYARQYGEHVRQVDLDVNRTYRDHIMFRERFGTKQVSLFNVLIAYSVYNSEVNYCQGMSQVAALLLMYMNDEEAFWGLSILLCNEHYMMHGFFVAGFPKLMRFNDHIWYLMKRQLPRLRKHLEKHDIRLDMVTVKWFMQCFLDRVPFSLALRLWDVYLYEGDKMLVAFAMATFKMHQRVLLKLRSMEEIMQYMQHQLPADFGGINDDDAIGELKDMMQLLRNRKMEKPSQAEYPHLPPGVIVENIPIGAARRSGRLSTSEVAAAAVATAAVVAAADHTTARSTSRTGNGRLSRAPSREELNVVGRRESSSHRRSSRQLSSTKSAVDDGFDTIPAVAGEEVFASTTADKSATLYDNVRGSGGRLPSLRTAAPSDGGELISRREYTREEESITVRPASHHHDGGTRRSGRRDSNTNKRSASSNAAQQQQRSYAEAADDDLNSEATTMRVSSRHRQPHPRPATVTTVHHTDIIRETRRVDDDPRDAMHDVDDDAVVLPTTPGRHDVRLRRPDSDNRNGSYDNTDAIYNEADHAIEYAQQRDGRMYAEDDAEERLANAEVQRITSSTTDEELHRRQQSKVSVPNGGGRGYVVHESLDEEHVDVRLPPRYVPRGGVRVLPAVPFGAAMLEEESTPKPHTDGPYNAPASARAANFYDDAPAVEVDEELARQRYIRHFEQQPPPAPVDAESIYANQRLLPLLPPPPQPNIPAEQPSAVPPPISRATKPRPFSASVNNNGDGGGGGGRDEHVYEEEINELVTRVEERRTVTRIGGIVPSTVVGVPPNISTTTTTTTTTRNGSAVPNALVPIGTIATIKTGLGAVPTVTTANAMERQQSTDTVGSTASSVTRRRLPQVPSVDNDVQPQMPTTNEDDVVRHITRIRISSPQPPLPSSRRTEAAVGPAKRQSLPPKPYNYPAQQQHAVSAPYVETNIDEVLPEDLLSGNSSNGGGSGDMNAGRNRQVAGKPPLPAPMPAAQTATLDGSYSSDVYSSEEYRESLELREQQQQLRKSQRDGGFYDMPNMTNAMPLKPQPQPPRSWLLANGRVQTVPVDEQQYPVTKRADDYANVYDQPAPALHNAHPQKPISGSVAPVIDRYVENISNHFQLPPLREDERVITTTRNIPKADNSNNNTASPPSGIEPPSRRRYFYNEADSNANILPSDNNNEPQAVRYTYYRRVSDDEEMVTKKEVVGERRKSSSQEKSAQPIDAGTYYNLSSSSSTATSPQKAVSNRLSASSQQQQYRYSNDYAVGPSRGGIQAPSAGVRG